MDRIVVAGGGGHGKVVIAILRKLASHDVAGYVDVENRGRVLSAEYLGDDGILEELIRERGIRFAALGIGHVRDSRQRQEICALLQAHGYELPAVISPDAVVNREVTVGAATVVMDGVVLNPGTRIGRACIINTRASIDHDCEIGEFTHVGPGAVICGGVDVGAFSLVGAGATVLPGLSIGQSCTVAAGATVVKDCAERRCYRGTPARPVP
jgi:UDP-perosamine 4-acetyltransferase